MHLSTVETVAVVVVVIALVTYRQTLWQPVRLARLLRLPAIFVVLGVVNLVSVLGRPGPRLRGGAADAALIGVELGLGLVAGWLMGRWTEIRGTGPDTRSHLRPAGLAVWLGFIAVRVGLGVAAVTFGATVAGQPATALLVVGVLKAVQAVRIRARIRHHQNRPLPRPAYAGDRV